MRMITRISQWFQEESLARWLQLYRNSPSNLPCGGGTLVTAARRERASAVKPNSPACLTMSAACLRAIEKSGFLRRIAVLGLDQQAARDRIIGLPSSPASLRQSAIAHRRGSRQQGQTHPPW